MSQPRLKQTELYASGFGSATTYRLGRTSSRLLIWLVVILGLLQLTTAASIPSRESEHKRQIVTAAGSTSSLPKPFDTSLGNNFTAASCPTFFESFLNDPTFRSCLPVSLLLQNSLSFFQAIRSKTDLEATLNQACSASLAECSPLMKKLAGELTSSDNCGNDYAFQNPLVMQAYNGFVAYEPMYKASCMKDAFTGQYCFSEAFASNNTADSSPYYTVIGLPMPASAAPTCNKCLQENMDIFAGYAVQQNQPLASTYLGCATQVDDKCGTTFAATQVQMAAQSKSSRMRSTMSSGVAVFVVTALMFVNIV